MQRSKSRKRGAEAVKKNYREKSRQLSRQRKMRAKFQRISVATAAVTAVLCAGLIGWAFYTGKITAAGSYAAERFFAMTSRAGLNLEHVYLEGLSRVDTATVFRALELPQADDRRQVPILSLDLPELKSRLEELGWVHSAVAARRLPGTLHIRISERIPRALWQHGGKIGLIDGEGAVIMEEGATAKAYPGLILLVGDDAPEHGRELLSFLESQKSMSGLVLAAVRVSGRRWNIRLNNGIEVKLPEKAPEEAWTYLAELQDTKRLLDRDIKSVDLRIKDRLFIEMNEAE